MDNDYMRETHRLPSYSYGGHDIYKLVPQFTAAYGTKVAIIGGETALSKAMPHLRPVLEAENITVIDEILFGGECSYATRDRLCAMKSVQEADFLFAIGGGKAIDTVKIVAKKMEDKPFFTFPTIAATCAANSEVAAVYTPEHVFEAADLIGHPALHCFIDGQILVEAPERFLWAGMGDTIAKRYETTFSARHREVSYNSQLGLTLAPMCSEPIFKHAIPAMDANKKQVRNLEFNEMAMAVIFTTAVVSGALSEAYNTGLAHAICYGCTTNHKTEQLHLHGELVSYGVLVLLIVDQQDSELKRWLPVYQELGWPRKLKDLHLTTNYIPTIIEKLMTLPDIEVSPYTIEPAMIEEAILKLEAL